MNSCLALVYCVIMFHLILLYYFYKGQAEALSMEASTDKDDVSSAASFRAKDITDNGQVQLQVDKNHLPGDCLAAASAEELAKVLIIGLLFQKGKQNNLFFFL